MLCTLDEVRDYLSMESSVANIDTLLENLIKRVSSFVDNYCDRTIETTTHTEYYDGNGTDRLYTLNYPITSVTNLWENTNRAWDTDDITDSDDYIVMENSILLKTTIFSNYPQCIKLTYVAGYATIPEDLKQLCIEEVSRSFNHKQDIGIISRGDSKGNITRIEQGLMKQSKEVLIKYRRTGLY